MAAIRDDLFARLSGTENPQGIIAIAEKVAPDREEFGKRVAGGNVLVMDRLQDPGNIGTVIRTVEAAGYRGVVTVTGGGDVYSPKAVRAAAGSLFRVPVINMPTADEALGFLRELGKTIVATSIEDAVLCFDADLRSNIALVIGNEGGGVSKDFTDAADIRVKIPMKGEIESLNAAVAAGILMYRSHI